MDRLTKHTGTQRYLDIDGELWSIGEANAIAHSMFDRLAAYEDTGLTPEEAKQLAVSMEAYCMKDCTAYQDKVDAQQQVAALQAKLDEARAVAQDIIARWEKSKSMDGTHDVFDMCHQLQEAVDRMRRIANDEPDAADRLMQVRLGGKHGKT